MLPGRILSLSPACTEMVYALGIGGRMIGRSHKCDYPAECAALPVCTKPAPDTGTPHGSFELDVALINELSPDLVLTDEPQPDSIEIGLASRLDFPAEIVSPQTSRLAHLWVNIQIVADAVGAGDEAPPLIKQLKNRLVDVIEKAAALTDRPRIACLQSPAPPAAAGLWIPDLVAMAGGTSLFGDAGKPAAPVPAAVLGRQDPDMLLFIPEDADLESARSLAAGIAGEPGWVKTRAVRDGKLFVADGLHFFHRAGPRLVEGVEILAEILHAEKCRYGHKGTGWLDL